MMGSNDKPQDEFFYSFNLEEVVPAGHLLRSIDRFLDRYRCPNGKELKRFRRNFKVPRTGVTKSNEIKYKASQMGLCCLSVEGAVLSERGVTQGYPQHPRVGARCCQGGATDTGLPSNATTT